VTSFRRVRLGNLNLILSGGQGLQLVIDCGVLLICETLEVQLQGRLARDLVDFELHCKELQR
jgi:hypothetical protein